MDKYFVVLFAGIILIVLSILLKKKGYALSSTSHVYCMIFQFVFSLIGAGLTVMSLALLILA